LEYFRFQLGYKLFQQRLIRRTLFHRRKKDYRSCWKQRSWHEPEGRCSDSTGLVSPYSSFSAIVLLACEICAQLESFCLKQISYFVISMLTHDVTHLTDQTDYVFRSCTPRGNMSRL